MKTGQALDVRISEDLSLTSYFLEHNLEAGRADKVAAYYLDQIYTFRDLCALTNKLGNVLKQFGVGLADRVLLVLQDRPEWLAGWFATMKVGGVATHVYTYLPAADYGYFIGYVQPRVVIVDTTTLEAVREGIRQAGRMTILLVAGDQLPPLEANEYGFDAMVAGAAPALDPVSPNRKNLAFWNFSGGTTGKPKGVSHSHDHGVVSCESFQHIIPYTPDDVVLRAPKLFFHYARDLGMNWALRAGASVCLCPERTTPEGLFELIAKHRPTILLNVPTMMRAMLKSPEAVNANLSSLRLCMSSGELLSEQLYKEFTDTFGVEVMNVHGSAESCLGYFINRPGKVKPGSSGTITPLVQVKIVDGEGNEVPQGDTGVVWVRSEASGSGYHEDPAKSRETFFGDNWINTNDLFREDQDGYFWYMGRANDIIKVSGVYVSPLEVEICLAEHPAVRECVVMGVEDADGLLKITAFVVLRALAEPSLDLAAELIAFCRQRMAPFKAPRKIDFQPNLAKTGQGKIDRRTLLERLSVGAEGSGNAFTPV